MVDNLGTECSTQHKDVVFRLWVSLRLNQSKCRLPLRASCASTCHIWNSSTLLNLTIICLIINSVWLQMKTYTDVKMRRRLLLPSVCRSQSVDQVKHFLHLVNINDITSIDPLTAETISPVSTLTRGTADKVVWLFKTPDSPWSHVWGYERCKIKQIKYPKTMRKLRQSQQITICVCVCVSEEVNHQPD